MLSGEEPVVCSGRLKLAAFCEGHQPSKGGGAQVELCVDTLSIIPRMSVAVAITI
jgi:hypothetical protein